MSGSAFMENLRQLFAECDTENNGSLGRKEFSQLCSKIGLNKVAADETFDRLDSDKNGCITFEEFAAGFNQYQHRQHSPTVSESPTGSSPGGQPRSSPAGDHNSSSSSLTNQLQSSSNTPDPDARSRSSNSNPSASLSPTFPQQPSNPVALRGRKSASPLGVISLGSTGGSGVMRPSSSSTGLATNHDRSSYDCVTRVDHGDNGPLSERKADSMIVYSSEAFAGNDYDQASGSGQFGSLVSSSGCGSLGQMRNVQELLDCVQKLQNENQILTQIFFKDKREREEYINQLGEEFDQQVREVEERAHRRAKEELESEKRRLREMMAAERETLEHHYKNIEKMSKLVKSSNGKLSTDDAECIDKVKIKLEDTYMENRKLKKSLLDTKTDVAMIWKEMENLKKQYEDKLSNAYEKNNETRNECDHIKQQLTLMKDSNKKLQDASDVITTYITDKVEPVIKVATGEEDPHGSYLSLNGLGRLSSSQSNSRRGSILSEYLHGGTNGDPMAPHSLDGYNGSVNSADLESFGSSGNLQQHMIKRNTNRFKAARGNDDEDDRESSSTSSVGNFHLRVPKTPTRTKSEQNLHHSSGDNLANDKELDNLANNDRLDEADQTKQASRNSKGAKTSISGIKGSSKSQVASNLASSQENQKPSGLNKIGRHFFIGSRTQSDAKLDQHSNMSGPVTELKQSASVDSSDLPIVEPADGPSKATFNIILVGDSFVGKSSFAARFMEGNFVQGLISNCSIDFKTKNYKVDGVNYTVNLWDTAGQERFRSITASYFRKADGIILMYDVTEKRSYLNVRNWMSTISDTAAEGVAVLLVGNKIDLRQPVNQDKCVPAAEGYRLAREYDIVFLETSVKTGINLVPSMGRLIRLIAKNVQPAEKDSDRIRLNDKIRTFNCMPKNC